MRDSLRVARSADRAYGDRLINCLVGLERFAEEPRIVLRLAEYMSGGVLARRDSETRRDQDRTEESCSAIRVPPLEGLVCNCGYARFRAPRCAS